MSKTVRLQAKAGAAPGWAGFMGWLADTHPQLYNKVRVMDSDFVQAAEQQSNAGSVILAGLSGDDAPAPAPSQVQQFLQTATAAAAAILPLVQQQKVLNMQLKRAQAGLPPLDVGAYIDPNQGMNVGITPATQKTLMYLVGGGIAAFLVSRVIRRR